MPCQPCSDKLRDAAKVLYKLVVENHPAESSDEYLALAERLIQLADKLKTV